MTSPAALGKFFTDNLARRAATLRETSHDFCHALVSPPPPEELLEKFFASNPRITEHGPSWANTRLPFLGKSFEGKEGCLKYFKVLADTLKMEMSKDSFPGKEGFIVDPGENGAHIQGTDRGKGQVSVVGKGRFESVKTGKAWDEQFIYRLSDFDVNGMIGHWEIWADPLSAWDAVQE